MCLILRVRTCVCSDLFVCHCSSDPAESARVLTEHQKASGLCVVCWTAGPLHRGSPANPLIAYIFL